MDDEEYDNWKNSAAAHIILQDLPFNWQLVKNMSEKSRAEKSAIQDLGSMSTSGYLGV